ALARNRPTKSTVSGWLRVYSLMLHLFQTAFLRYARFSTPMMPNRLTARPIRTSVMRPVTLDVMPRLKTAITNPSSVIASPVRIIAISLSLLRCAFYRLALAHHDDRRDQQSEKREKKDDAASGKKQA